MKKLLIVFLIISVLMLVSCSNTPSDDVITLATPSNSETVESTSSTTQATQTDPKTETTQTQQVTTKSVETVKPQQNSKELLVYTRSILVFCDVYDENTLLSDGIRPFNVPAVLYSYDSDKNAINQTEGVGRLIQLGDLRYLFGDGGVSYNASEYATQLSAKERLYFKCDAQTVLGTMRVYNAEHELVYTEDIDSNSCDVSSLEDGEYIISIEVMHKAFEVLFIDGTKVIPNMDMSYMVLKLTK